MDRLEQIIEVAKDLIRFPSTRGRPADREACSAYIEKFLADAGIPFTAWEPGDVRSLTATIGEPGRGPHICLNGHYDVVEAPASGFRPKLDGDRLRGRGSADMKTSLAAMMVLFRELSRGDAPPHVTLMAVGDEETGGEKGTAHILGEGFSCDLAIVGEPTGLALANQAKGFLSIELTARGNSCHSARPWEGDNPFFTFFRQFPAVWEIFGDAEPGAWKTTLTPTVVRAGDSPNRVAQSFSCRVDVRHVPMDEPGDIVERIGAAAPELLVRVAEQGAAFYTDIDNELVRSLRRAASEAMRRDPGTIRKHAASDARHFSERGVPAIVFGPGGEGIHGKDEHVDLRQVKMFYRSIELFFEGLSAAMRIGDIA